MDTFDLKPGHENGGSFKEIATSVPGIRISEHLPKIAAMAQHMAIVRSMSTKEGDHGRATYLMRNGYLPQPPVRYPTLGSLVAKELGDPQSELPSFVSVAPFRNFNPAAYGPGFLGSKYAPLLVGESAGGGNDDDNGDLTVADLAPPDKVSSAAIGERLGLLNWLNDRFVGTHAAPPAVGYKTAYDRAVKLMRSDAAKAFDLDEEPDKVRDAYGRNRFGQGCLLARRLVERGVPFIEVTHGGAGQIGWDTHTGNFEAVKELSGVLDPAWASLMSELQSRGLLESTLIVWMGEFGRTPVINSMGGRDHFPNAWSCVLAGGGVKGGQAYGRTSDDGMKVEEKPVAIGDVLATLCEALGVPPDTENMAMGERPIKIAEGTPIAELLA
jgi:hypothetical protein